MQGDDPDLARALAASMADPDRPGPSGSRPQSRSAWGATAPLAGGAAGLADDEDADLAAAIAASLADNLGSSQQQGAQQQEEEQGGAAGAAAAAEGSQPGSPAGASARAAPVPAAAQHGQRAQRAVWFHDEDPELAAAIAASLERPSEVQQQQQQEQEQASTAPGEQPEAGQSPAVDLPELSEEPEAGAAGAIEVALRLPGGGRASRRFNAAQDMVGQLAAFAAQQGADMAGCQLAAQFPRRVFGDWSASLAAAGVGHKELVTVEPKQP